MVRASVPATRGGRATLLLVVAAWLVGGVLLGRAHAYNQSVGGMTAAFGGIVFVLAAAVLLVFGLAAAVVERSGRAPRGAGRRALVAGIAGLLVGGLLGYATAAATGGTYAEPATRQSLGTTNAEITSPSAAFVPRADGPATCGSVGDGDALASVAAEDLGELAGGTLRGSISIDSAARVTLDLFIDGADLAGDAQPTWSGVGSVSSTALDGRTTTVTFDSLPAGTDPKLPPPDPAWAGALSGSIAWTCAPFE